MPPNPLLFPLSPSPPSRSKLEYIITAIPCEPNWLLFPLGHWQQIVCLNKSLVTTHPVQVVQIWRGCNFSTSVSFSTTLFPRSCSYGAADDMTCCPNKLRPKCTILNLCPNFRQFLNEAYVSIQWVHERFEPKVEKIELRFKNTSLKPWFL